MPNSISVPSADFAKMGFTHYYNHGNRTTCFSLDKCENCGEPIMAPNSIGGDPRDIPFYKKNCRMVEHVGHLPEEGYYSDALEGEACYNCNA